MRSKERVTFRLFHEIITLLASHCGPKTKLKIKNKIEKTKWEWEWEIEKKVTIEPIQTNEFNLNLIYMNKFVNLISLLNWFEIIYTDNKSLFNYPCSFYSFFLCFICSFFAIHLNYFFVVTLIHLPESTTSSKVTTTIKRAKEIFYHCRNIFIFLFSVPHCHVVIRRLIKGKEKNNKKNRNKRKYNTLQKQI